MQKIEIYCDKGFNGVKYLNLNIEKNGNFRQVIDEIKDKCHTSENYLFTDKGGCLIQADMNIKDLPLNENEDIELYAWPEKDENMKDTLPCEKKEQTTMMKKGKSILNNCMNNLSSYDYHPAYILAGIGLLGFFIYYIKYRQLKVITKMARRPNPNYVD